MAVNAPKAPALTTPPDVIEGSEARGVPGVSSLTRAMPEVASAT